MRRTLRVALVGLFLFATGAAYAQKPGPNEMLAHFIEVGQADATLLEFSCGLVMIDAGAQRKPDKDRLLAYLDAVFARRGESTKLIQTVFITHNHKDHQGALPDVLKRVTVNNLIMGGIKEELPGVTSPAPLQIDDDDVQGPIGLTNDAIDSLACEGTDPHIAILSGRVRTNPGWSGKEFQNENNHSLVIRVDFGHASFLFTGDMEEKALDALVAYWNDSGGQLDTDVYQVGHHGAKNATTAGLMSAVTPALAVISMGRCDKKDGRITAGPSAWGYGHPTDIAVDRIAREVVAARPPTTVWVSNTSKLGTAREFFQRQVITAVFGTGWDGHVVVHATANRNYEVTLTPTGTPPACTQNAPSPFVAPAKKR